MQHLPANGCAELSLTATERHIFFPDGILVSVELRSVVRRVARVARRSSPPASLSIMAASSSPHASLRSAPRALQAEEAGPADLESETRKLMLHRRLLGKPRKRPEVNAEVDPPQQASAPAQVPQTAGFKQNPHAATGEALMPSSTELKAMNLLLNVSVSDGTCQVRAKPRASARTRHSGIRVESLGFGVWGFPHAK